MRPMFAPKAPPAKFNLGSNVHTFNDIASLPLLGQCHCCTTCNSRQGTKQMMIQEQQTSMADNIRMPRRNKQGPDDESNGGGSGDESRRGEKKDNKKKELLDDDGDDHNDFESDESDGDSDDSHNRRRTTDNDSWKFDSRLLKPPDAYDGIDLTYFQPWLELLQSEMMSKWEPWGDILRVLEGVGERRLDLNPIEISDIFVKSNTKRTVNQIQIEIFRILKVMTSGEAQLAIVQGVTPGVFDVFRWLICKGKSRTKAAVRELRQKINMLRRAKSIVDYGNVVAELDATIAKLVSYRGQDALLLEEDLLEAYNFILPPEVMTFVELKIDEAHEPDGFREEMEKHIYRRTREAKTTKALLANVMEELQEQLQNMNEDQGESPKLEDNEEPSQFSIKLFKGKGKKGKGKGKGPTGGNGLCFDCGEPGHYASNCDKPKKDPNEKRSRQRRRQSRKRHEPNC